MSNEELVKNSQRLSSILDFLETPKTKHEIIELMKITDAMARRALEKLIKANLVISISSDRDTPGRPTRRYMKKKVSGAINHEM